MLIWISLLLPTITLAQINPDDVAPVDPVIAAQGQEFASWDDYKQSALFRETGLRCKTAWDTDAALAASTLFDCTYGFTNPSPEYAPTTLIEIPVVFHCIYRTDGVGFIPESAIESEILQMNQRFRAFAGSGGGAGNDTMIQFHLATEDESGHPTNGITYTENDTWFADGGGFWIPLSWDTNRYMNIYSNDAGGFLGYVSALPQQGFVGSASDRMVLLWSTVGANAPIGPPYDQGTIGTHEAGHFLGLHHTFKGGCAPRSVPSLGRSPVVLQQATEALDAVDLGSRCRPIPALLDDSVSDPLMRPLELVVLGVLTDGSTE